MAEYCKQCAEDYGFPDHDFKGLTPQESWFDGFACIVICEGCGAIQVNPEGECVSPDCLKPGHNKPVFETP